MVLHRPSELARLIRSWPLPPGPTSGGERNSFNCALKESIVLSGVPVATTNDFRRYPRLPSPKGTILAWQSASIRQVSRVANLALGGLYIRTSEPPPPGTFIQLLLDVPTGEVRARAIVQRSKPKEGMGVKFVAMQQEDRARFARWLRSKQELELGGTE
jgi:PilZ domain